MAPNTQSRNRQQPYDVQRHTQVFFSFPDGMPLHSAVRQAQRAYPRTSKTRWERACVRRTQGGRLTLDKLQLRS